MPSTATVAFGNEFRFGSGITIAISEPKSFRPSETAYPQSPRAVAFEITVLNDSPQPYRLSGLAVKATIADEPTKQVVDATQGYNGIVDADRDLQPNRKVRLSLAFAVPATPTELCLTVRPDPGMPATAMYRGSV